MADTVSPEQRRINMQHIRSCNTEPEVYLRKLLFHNGFRYSLYSKKIPGHPDLWMPKYNTAVYVNGCFWHRHFGCRFSYMPKSRVEYWSEKFNRNVDRDRRVKEELKNKSIKRLTVWECTIKEMRKNTAKEKEVTAEIERFLLSDEDDMEI